VAASPASTSADSASSGQCYLEVIFDQDAIAYRWPCQIGEVYSVATERYSVEVEIEKNSAVVSISAEGIVFFSEKRAERFRLSKIGTTLPIYDMSSEDYISGSLNEPIGTILFKFARGDEK
jgi:hypothetical protein